MVPGGRDAHNGAVESGKHSSVRVIRDGASVILLDPALADTPVETGWFEPDFWAARGQLTGRAKGRGSVAFVSHEGAQWALRHYQRGGLIGRIIYDRYLYTGHARVRAVREFELLSQLRDWSLPTAVPIAARYARRVGWYRADLLTEKIDYRQTLAEYLARPSLEPDELNAVMAKVHRIIAQFHDRGVYHADLNCHNILLGEDAVSIIDFDRGELRAPGNWQQANLDRLIRSALKVSQPTSHGAIMDACKECFGG